MPKRVSDPDYYGIGQSYVNLYTQAELDQAVKEEREACIIECVKVANKYEGKYLDDAERENYIGMLSAEICAEAIRNRNKEIDK